MRKTPPIDPAPEPGPARDDPATQPTLSPAPAEDDPHTVQSLVWPPVDDDLSVWEVVQFQSAGDTIVAPGAPPAARPEASASVAPPTFGPPTPAPYMPPAPLDDPAGETSLLPPPSSDFDLPQTELIEPLAPDAKVSSGFVRRTDVDRFGPSSLPDRGDDRTVVIPRPTFGPVRLDPSEDTNPGNAATRVLISPAFAASMGHAPTVPVSALHRSAAKPDPVDPSAPRPPMEDTLPAGVTRELPAIADARRDADPTGIHRGHGDTHPMTAPVLQRVPVGSPPSSPFSRAASRGAHPIATDPPPVVPSTPLAFGPPASTAAEVPPPSAATFPAPAPVPQTRDLGVPTRRAPASTQTKIVSVGLGVAVLMLLALGAYQLASMRSTSAGAPAAATLSVESTPAGAEVTIDGTPRGKTPLRLELTEGAHSLDVSHAGATKRIPLTLAAGTVTAHSLEFATAPAPVAADSAIEVRSDPAGARVVIDGVERGRTPLVVTGLTSGKHEVQVSGPFPTVTEAVTLRPRQQARVIVTPARADAAPAGRGERPERASRAAATGMGFVTIESPIVLRVVRNGDFIGTSEDSRLSLPVGSQVIGLENESVGFRDVRTVEVVPGKATPIVVTPPNGTISINARPWAEVYVDGARVGDTPVSQLSLPIGIHEIVFRHPELGERRQSVVVKIGATQRAFTDFTK